MATTGPELYPPTPITRSGFLRDTRRHASSADNGSSAAPRSRVPSDLPFKPALRITSSSNPSRGTTRPSMPRAVPAKLTVVPGRWACSSRATAMPG